MKRVLIAVAACVAVRGLTLVVSWPQRPASDTGLEEIAPGDAQFWLMQSGRSDRLIPCSARYRFDSPVDEALLRERLQALTAPYRMFRRNVVEVNGLPYWQSVNIDWNVNFRVLEPEEDADAVRDAAEVAVSQASAPGDGVPLFRAILSADGRELTFVWHHVISDLEGMFNAHARHLFAREDERTRFGYQITEASAPEGASPSSSLASAFAERPLGFTGYGFDVGRHVLPVTDVALHALGAEAGLPMSDVFSLIALRTVTRYHADDAPEQVSAIRPMVTPLSLRKDSRTVDEGNRRAVKQFPIVFPLQPLDATVERLRTLAPASTSYEMAGRALRFGRSLPLLEEPIRRAGMPDYISNYFPLADAPLVLGEARVVRHDLRVPMVPFERTKFAWSNYDGEVQLFLHTDPELIDAVRMAAAFEAASAEVLGFLRRGA